MKKTVKIVKTILVLFLVLFLIGCKEAHTHTYTIDIVDPTCTTSGYTTYTCECGQQYIDNIIEARGHKEKIISGTEATCNQEGKTDKVVCEICGVVILDHKTITSKIHVYSDYVVVQEATEKRNGIEEKTCQICGDKVQREIAKLKHEHKYNRSVVAPTCTEQGYTKYQCSCGDEYKSDYSPSTGHEFGEYRVVTEPTETVPGIKEKQCKKCYKYDYESIPILNHTHDYKKSIMSATCEQIGIIVLECPCGDIVEEIIPAHGHTYTESVIYREPTDKEEGILKNICSKCGHTSSTLIPKLEHKHSYSEWQIIVQPTEKEEGKKERFCTGCGNIETSVVEKLPHSHVYGDWELVLEATDQIEGKMQKICTGCGLAEIMTIPKLTHKHSFGEWEITVPSTEETKGERQKKCIGCDEVVKESIPVLVHQHVYDAIIIAPTCEQYGYTKHICMCGETYFDSYIMASGHKLSKSEVVKDATEEEAGLSTQTCSICGVVVQIIIPVIGHVHEFIGAVVDPTCTTMGYTLYVCECKVSYKEDFILPHDHTFVKVSIDKQPTCETLGLATCRCEDCGIEKTESIPTTQAHNGEMRVLLKESTCVEEGQGLFTCKDCKQEYIGSIPKAENHSPIVTDVLKEATCTTSGTGKAKCSQCGINLGYVAIKPHHTPFLVDVLKEPTCTEAGVGKFVCEFCTEDLGYNEIPKAHKWGGMVIETYPTDVLNGKAVQLCDVCGEANIIILVHGKDLILPEGKKEEE